MENCNKLYKYPCVSIQFDFNMCNTEFTFYELKSENVLTIADNPIEENHLESLDDSIKSKIRGLKVYLLPSNLKIYLDFLNDSCDRYLEVFFKSLQVDLQNEFSKHTEVTLKNIDILYRTKNNILDIYQKCFTYLYSMQDTMGYQLLFHEGSYQFLFQEYFNYYFKNEKN